MNNEERKRKVMKIISEIFGDISVPQSETKEVLESIVSDIEDYINTLN